MYIFIQASHGLHTDKPHKVGGFYQYNFSFRVVNDWNNVPDWVVNVSNVLNFERKLDKFWKTQDRKFNYKS